MSFPECEWYMSILDLGMPTIPIHTVDMGYHIYWFISAVELIFTAVFVWVLYR